MSMKRYLVVFGVLGVVGCCLPLVGGLALVGVPTVGAWLTILAFALPALVAMRAGDGTLAGVVGYGYLALKIGPHALGLVLYAGIGGKLIAVAAIGGVIATIGALLERAPATR
jgi:hypothetical protein